MVPPCRPPTAPTCGRQALFLGRAVHAARQAALLRLALLALRARKGQQRRRAARLPPRCRHDAARLRRRQDGLGPRCKGVSGRLIRACVGVWQRRQGTKRRERVPHLSRRPPGRASCGPSGPSCDGQSPGIEAASQTDAEG